jgi:hypothetical protein
MEPVLRIWRAMARNSSEQCSDVAAAIPDKKNLPKIMALIEQLNRDLDEFQRTLLGRNKGAEALPGGVHLNS